jgi:outer membrane protein assembly factor BamB
VRTVDREAAVVERVEPVVQDLPVDAVDDPRPRPTGERRANEPLEGRLLSVDHGLELRGKPGVLGDYGPRPADRVDRLADAAPVTGIDELEVEDRRDEPPSEDVARVTSSVPTASAMGLSPRQPRWPTDRPPMPTRRQFLQVTGAGAMALLAGRSSSPSPAGRFDPLAPTTLDEFATAQFQGDLRNRGYVEATVPDRVEVNWSLPVNRGEHTAAKSTPVATPDGDVVVAADTGTLRRVTPEGDVEWTAEVEATTRGMHGTPAIANGDVYVGAYDGALYAFDLETGQRRWRTSLGDAIGSSPKYYNGVCYIAVEYADPSGSVAAVDAAAGGLRWIDHRPTSHPHSTIGIDREAGRLVVGSNDQVCYAWTFPSLDRAWTFETDGAIKGPVAIHDGLAIFGSWDDTLYAVDLEDGTEVWSFGARADVMTGPAIDPDGTVYLGSHDDDLYALDGTDGTELWRYATRGNVIGAITATPDHVLAGSYDARFYAVGADEGRHEWYATGRGRATSGALVTGGAVYYTERATEDEPGRLYRLVAV